MRNATTLLLCAGLMTSTAAFAGGRHHHHHHGHGHGHGQHHGHHNEHGHGNTSISLQALGTYKRDTAAGAEISAYDARTQRVFVTNVANKTVDVLDIQNPAAPIALPSIELTNGPTSVTVKDRLVAIAVPNADKVQPGTVEFYDTNGAHKRTCPAGALPDMVTFTPDGRYVLVANEGEPNDDYSTDPEGSVSIIDVRSVKRGRHCQVRTADFARFNPFKAKLQAKGVRIYGPQSSVAQNVEPEYIAVSDNSRTAWVALQENNAFAVVDIARAKVVKILPLGLKDHSKPGSGLDASDRDDAINIANWPVFGMYQPDGIAAYSVGKKTYIISANEGDTRDYDAYGEEERVKDVTLDPAAFPNASDLQENEQIGRLTISTATGDLDNDGDFDQLHVPGARSFSIWTGDGKLVYDSGDDIEQRTAVALPDSFNANNDDNDSFDSRSDNKGPEPEGVTTGEINGQTYAFLGLERIGGVMVYNVTRPHKPSFVTYVNRRDFDVEIPGDPTPDDVPAEAGDLAPEGLTFIAAKDSPNRKPLLVVTNEVSGTTTIFEINTERTYAHR
jgi:DNA-binding beta-propeller fold protein YncE